MSLLTTQRHLSQSLEETLYEAREVESVLESISYSKFEEAEGKINEALEWIGKVVSNISDIEDYIDELNAEIERLQELVTITT